MERIEAKLSMWHWSWSRVPALLQNRYMPFREQGCKSIAPGVKLAPNATCRYVPISIHTCRASSCRASSCRAPSCRAPLFGPPRQPRPGPRDKASNPITLYTGDYRRPRNWVASCSRCAALNVTLLECKLYFLYKEPLEGEGEN